MAKKKTKKSKPREGKYAEKLAVGGSFKDILIASVKHAEKQSAPKKS